ncbi:Transcriptional regulator, AbiEi antitoxin, Type IV TA system [Arthrobacter sp. 49Tsu3.1M3]|uniref:hypothetical protein n=1 Tax=Arthrobacter sp. 49Tsu3.1M3 TaxID=1279029 RepID=UPI0009A63FEB|nr:hypothetical protein [Arthrobacter sp. 49Tsu3.1M3]SKB53373.1 Transcriptional regulator, AbiEi antitoxin, Type IV TA system [Arthrobacter sp. 49Tsu3.1M3]
MDLPRLILSSDLARLGADARGRARQAESGQLRRIRQGVYVRAQEWEALPPWDRYRVLIRAAASTLRSRTVFCRQSSAVLWDMPVLGHSHLVHACTSDGGGGRSRAGVRRHLVDLGSVQIEERHGLLVTDRVRTALDLAASESFEQGVAVFDHVLGPRPGTLSRGELDAEYLRGRTPAEALTDEKRREDRIRATGRHVIRWTWTELANPGSFSAFLADAGVPRQPLPSCRR